LKLFVVNLVKRPRIAATRAVIREGREDIARGDCTLVPARDDTADLYEKLTGRQTAIRRARARRLTLPSIRIAASTTSGVAACALVLKRKSPPIALLPRAAQHLGRSSPRFYSYSSHAIA